MVMHICKRWWKGHDFDMHFQSKTTLDYILICKHCNEQTGSMREAMQNTGNLVKMLFRILFL